MRKAISIDRRASRLFPAMLAVAPATVALAQDSTMHQPPPNMVWRWLGAVLMIVPIWLLFYKLLYPMWVRYYNPDYCKSVFWFQFLMFVATWAHLAGYVLFDYGFYAIWWRWVGLFLGVVWFIAMFVFAFRPGRA